MSRALTSAVDMMRRMTEELHPTLLDNVGLFAALRRQVQQMCHRSKIICRDQFPNNEPALTATASISLFRIGQEALTITKNRPGVTTIDFTISIDSTSLSMKLMSDGAAPLPTTNSQGLVALELLRHRMQALGGTVSVACPEGSGMLLVTQVALTNVLQR
jgi:signal transduction histidine kinase